MSTTIEGRGPALRSARLAGGGLLVAAIWFTGLAAATLIAEPTAAVAVFGPQARTIGAIAGGDSLLVDSGSGYLIVRGQHAGFVRALYAGGAWLVLPVSGGGCLPSRNFASAKYPGRGAAR